MPADIATPASATSAEAAAAAPAAVPAADAPRVEVTANPAYLTQEQLGQILATNERLTRLIESGRIAPLAATPAAEVEVNAQPEMVRRGYRTIEDWDQLTAAVRESVGGAGGTKHARALLTHEGFVLGNGRKLRVSEAVHTNEFPYLLRSGFKTILFNEFAEQPTTYQLLAQMATSDKSVEEWLELSRLGRPGRVDEDQEYPEVTFTGLPPSLVRNHKRGYILKITQEMIKFDKTNQILQLAGDRGAAMKEEIDNSFWTIMRTAANYNRSSADNNVGNNQGTAAFSPGALITSYETLVTMKEGRSGRFLGIVPDVLWCGTAVVFAAMQLLKSARIASGEDGATAAGGIGGVPENNPLAGLIGTIVSTPQVGRYEWGLGQKGKGVVYQEVEPLDLLDQNAAAATNEGYFSRDVWKYRARTWYGAGIYDDRRWMLQKATTAPDWT